MTYQAIPLPQTVEEVTPSWLEAALSARRPGIEVTSFEIVDVIWGTATKVLVRAEYRNAGPTPPPALLWVKGCLDERVRAHAGGGIFVLEAQFYAELAGDLELPLPEVVFAASDNAKTQGIVVMEHLDGDHASFGEIGGRLMSPDQVAAGLETQARWHGATFGEASAKRFSWLLPAGPFRTFVTKQLTESYWNAQFSLEGAVALPSGLQDRKLLCAGFDRLWRSHDSAVPCLIHGDAHVGNTYLDAAGRTGFIDWQTPCLGPWACDVAYFIASALSIDDRRANERHLLTQYLADLKRFGGPHISADEAWRDYRSNTLYGFAWALTSPSFNSLERTVAMAKLYIAAIEDHEPLKDLARLAA